jgi:hypothetical protein
LAGGYLLVGLLWWFNFVWTGGGWRLSLAVLWTALGVGMAFVTRSSRRGRAKKLRQRNGGDRSEATKVDVEKRQARLYEWVSVLAALGGANSLGRKALDAKSRMESSRKSVDRPERPGPRDVSENKEGPPRGE